MQDRGSMDASTACSLHSLMTGIRADGDERRQRLLRQQRRQVDLCQLESPCVRDTQTLTCCILSHCEAFVRHNMRAAQVGCVSALVAASSKVPTDD